MYRFIAAAAALLISSAARAQDRGTVIGYIAAFKGLDSGIKQAHAGNYPQLDLAFVNPTPAGEVLSADGLACAPTSNGAIISDAQLRAPTAKIAMISDAQLRALVAAAHESGTRLVASLGGAIIPACGGDWQQLLSPDMRPKVIASVLAMVDRYGFDGVDIDLEGDLMTGIDRAGNYTPFVHALADGLHARSKLLTAATASYPGGMVPDASLPYFDIIGVMSYDQVGPTWGSPGGEHSTYAQAETDLRLWIGKGVPASKLALGMPFYGRGFGSYRESWSLADIADSFGLHHLNSDVVGKLCGGCSYITYNGLPTLERKAELAGAWGAGVMVWEIGQDLPGDDAIRRVDAAYRKGRADADHH
jgi:chitinase